MTANGASLVLGPMLRYADGRRATIWVETDVACDVEVSLGDEDAGTVDARARTFTVHGHHYALVVVDGLSPGRTYPYTVRLDGVPVWGGTHAAGERAGDQSGERPGEQAGPALPPSRVRTLGEGRELRLVLGSCRTSVGHTRREWVSHGVDALRAYALRMADAPESEWPDALLLLGDQVYADETTPAMREAIASRRSLDEPPGAEVADFAEYTHLYRIAWSDPVVRWLLSTVPTAMVFDDHDIRDDWNTSDAWRARMADNPWWHRRVVGGLGAYWLYQHMGNLSPDELAVDPVLAEIRRRAAAGEDGGGALDEAVAEVDADPTRYRWSYVRDLGPARLVMVDSRCGRLLDPAHRLIVDTGEWAWVEEQAEAARGHVLLGTSLPYLLPPGVHHLEAWNEAVCAGAWGRRFARLGERVRQGVDLEHWAAFRRSFAAMASLLRRLVTGEHPPVSVVLLSGDVHYSYLARARLAGVGTQAPPVAQVVCSPVRNPLGRVMRYANVVAQIGVAGLFGRLLARAAGVADPASDPGIRWGLTSGPWFPNCVAGLTLDDRSVHVVWEGAEVGEAGREMLERLGEADLRGGPAGRGSVQGSVRAPRGLRSLAGRSRARWQAAGGRRARRRGSAPPRRRRWPRRHAGPRRRHGDGA